MKPSTMKAFAEMMKQSNRPPAEGVNLSDHADKTFSEFKRGLEKFMFEGDIDPQMLALVGAGFELTLDGARTTFIKRGMLEMMISIADYCFKDEKREFVLEKVAKKKEDWRKKIAELDERTAKLANLMPDDILNAKPLEKQPHE